jgi:hypothetical protein
VCRRTKSHLVVRQCARLGEDLLRDRDLADVVQLGRVADCLQLLGGNPQPASDGLGEVGDAGQVLAERGVALVEHPQEDVHALAAGRRAMTVLVHVHAAVGDSQRVRHTIGLVRKQHRPVRTGDGEALALLAEGGCRGVDQRTGPHARRGADNAELVAAHPIRAAATGDGGLEAPGEMQEQRIPRRVAERVVVELESVEVEEDQDEGLAGVGTGQLLHDLAHEPRTVAERGERVRERLLDGCGRAGEACPGK